MAVSATSPAASSLDQIDERVIRPPVQLTSFVGRERELANAQRLLTSSRLLTLTGAGGTGKTRLAIELAAREAANYVGGAVWVDLAVVEAPSLVTWALGQALGVSDQSGSRSAIQVCVDLLRDRPALIVLDNCEHLVATCASLADTLLRGCPDIRIIATSREALGVAGEVAWLVPALSLPASDVPGDSEAVQLFVERARSVLPGFQLTDTNAGAIAQICRRLDGLPLALELAAARLRALPPEQLAERLDDRFRLLKAGNRAALPRHQTLRAAIDWSYELLGDNEKLLLASLSVFGGSFALDAAEFVCARGAIEPDDVLDLLASLVDKSLLELVDATDVARYRLLETVREYGIERLEERGEEQVFRRRHAEFFESLAAEAEPHLVAATRPAWMARLQADVDNLRQALLWTFHADPAAHARLAASLGWFWYSAGLWTQGRQWNEDALKVATEPTRERGKILFGAGVIASLQGNSAIARAWLDEALRIAQSLGDAQLAAYSRNYLGVALVQEGDPRGPGYVETAIEWFRQTGDLYGHRLALLILGTNSMQQGETGPAVELIREALQLARTFGLDREIGISLNMLGLALMQHGEFQAATRALRESLESFHRDPQYLFTARSMETLAAIAVRMGSFGDASRLYGAAEGIRQKIGAVLFGQDHRRLAPLIAQMRASAGDVVFDRARADGRAMSLDQAIEFGIETSTRLWRGLSSTLGASPPTAAAAKQEPEPALATSTAIADGQQRKSLIARVLGPLEIEVDDVRIPSSAWSYAKPRELFMYLLVHPEGRTRDQIGHALWPDASAAQVRNNFHVTLHYLRKVLGGADIVKYERDAYRLNPERHTLIDASVFEAKVTAALRDARRGKASIDELQSAIALYRGEFLEGDAAAGDWHLEIRDRLQRLHDDAVMALGGALSVADRHTEAADAFQQLLAKDSLREDAVRGLMVARARAGDRTEAMRQYRRLVDVARRELESEPESDTTALFQRLQRGETI